MKRITLLLQFSVISLVLMIAIGLILGFDLTNYFQQAAINQQRDAIRDLVPPIIGDHITDDVLANGAQGASYKEIELALGSLGGSGLVRVKIWNRDGIVVYSDDPTLIGQKYPLTDELQQTFSGLTVADLSPLTKAENVEERGFGELLEVYTPVRQGGKPEIVGSFEGYYDITDLRERINNSTRVPLDQHHSSAFHSSIFRCSPLCARPRSGSPTRRAKTLSCSMTRNARPPACRW